MKDEIKEILDDLLFTTTLPNVSVKLSDEKLNQLKDYITNLQEERNNMACLVNDLQEKIDKAIPMLEELNIKLKDILKIGIDIKEITDIKNILQGKSDE